MSKRYVVQREAIGDNGEPLTDQNGTDTLSRVPLLVCATRAEAEAFLAELTAEAQRTMNPFELDLTGGTITEEKELMAALVALPIRWEQPFPVNTYMSPSEWAPWWDGEAPHLTDAERVMVWAAFPRKLYSVAEVNWS